MNSRNGQNSHQDQDSEAAQQSQSQESEPGKNSNRNIRVTMARSTKSHSSIPLLFKQNNGVGSTRSSLQQMYPSSKQGLEKVFEHKTYPTKSFPRLPKASISEKPELNLMLKEKLTPKINQLSQILPSISKNQKQEYHGAGIALNLEEKNIGFQIQMNKVEKQKLSPTGFREWAEYEKIREGQIIVTIEYCSNCKDHQITTRHDERKYEFIANSLKQDILCNFPIIKIKMKPLLTNILDQMNQYVRSRIGAMEVQLCKNKNGKIQKVSIFSKLKTQQWPSPLEVLNEIRKYMDKCSLTIYITQEPFDQMDIDEERNRTSENKLCNLEVILRPFKSVNKNPLLAYQQLKQPGQDSMSPQSPSNEFSIQSHSQLPQIRQQAAPQKSQIEIKEKSNPEGIVIFKDLPFSVYTLKIKETNDFLSCKDEIDIFKKVNERKKFEDIIHKVSLKPVPYTYAKITLKCDANLKKSLIRIIKEEPEETVVDDKIKFEFNTKFKSGKYWVIIENRVLGKIELLHDFLFGNQELHLSQEDFQAPPSVITPEEQRRVFSPKQQRRDSTPKQQRRVFTPEQQREHVSNITVEQPIIPTRPQLPSTPAGPQKELTFIIYEVGSKNSAEILGCKIKIKDKKETQKFITNSGRSIIPMEGFSSGTIEINHIDFFPICEEYGPNYMNLNLIKELSFPLIRKPQSENEVNILFFSDQIEKVLTLHLIGPDGQTINEQNKSIGIEFETNPEGNSSSIKITKARETNGIYRIIAKVHNLSFLTPSLVKLYVITSLNTLNFVEVPMSHPTFRENSGELYWDIGALYVPTCQFVEVNTVFQPQNVSLDYGLEVLKLIVDMLQKVQKREKKGNESEFRSILGLPQADWNTQSKNDLYLSKDTTIKSLSKAIGQKTDPLILEHLINSSLVTKNQCSYLKLRKKFLSIQFPEVIVDLNENSFHEAPDEDHNDLDLIDEAFYIQVDK